MAKVELESERPDRRDVAPPIPWDLSGDPLAGGCPTLQPGQPQGAASLINKAVLAHMVMS